MTTAQDRRSETFCEVVVLLVALVLAVVGARDQAGSWNDGSRLATVESLVDQHTWSIDESSFVVVPPPGSAPSPYPTDNAGLMTGGTRDKLLIHDHFYSDKPPVQALLMAVEYRAWQSLSGETFRTQADQVCRLLTIGSSGLSYIVALWCLFRMGGVLGLPLTGRLLLTGSLAVGSVAWPYALAVNGHEPLLAVAMAMLLLISMLAKADAKVSPWKIAALGALGGLGYTLDLGAGPVLLAATGLWVLLRLRSLRWAVLFAATALPGLVLHHLINYVVTGSWGPANADPAHFNWPDCPFDATTMTGRWNHAGPGTFVIYALGMLLGKRGILFHNPPLLLALVGPPLLLQLRRTREKSEMLLGLGWSVGVWLLYAATSRNWSGECISIRWLVPLLAPGYHALAILLRDCPRIRNQLVVLAVGGVVLGVPMAWYGPWIKHMIPGYWFIVGAILLAWGAAAWRDRALLKKATLAIYDGGDMGIRQAA